METVGAYEAKTHLPKLLERVLKGERITITKHGVPVAVFRKFRDKHSLSGLSIRDMIEEGRRYMNPIIYDR